MRPETFVMDVVLIDSQFNQLLRDKLHKRHRAAEIELHLRGADLVGGADKSIKPSLSNASA